MDTAEPFASQWQNLKEKRQQIIDKTDQLKRKLGSLLTEPAMRQLIEEKAQIKEKIPELSDKVEMHKSKIENKLYFIKRRRRAVSDKRIQQEFSALVNKYRYRMERLKKLGAPEIIHQAGL